MKKIGKFIAICLVLAMAVSVFAGCGDNNQPAPSATPSESQPQAETQSPEDTAADSEVARIKAAGELVMLTNAAFPPFEYLGSDNQPVGVDVDIAQLIADELGVELKVVNMDFDGIVPALVAGKGDIGVAGMTVKPDRLESVDFTTKYVTSSQYMIVQADNQDVKTAADLAGKVIGVQEGTTGDFYATDETEAKSVEKYKTAIDAAAALMNGKIDVVIVDEMPAKAIAKQNANSLKTIDEQLTTEDYAIAVKKKSDLTAEINGILEKLVADGTVDQLILKHTTGEE